MDLGLARIGSWDWDPATRTLHTSATCRRLLHLPQSDVTAADVAAVVHPEDLPRLLSTAEDCLRGEAECRVEFRVRRDAGWDWVEAAGRRLRRAGEPVGHLVGILVDVTERRLAEGERELWQRRTGDALAELERTTHRMGRLLKTASHDLRTPLNAVLGWCHILGSEADRPEQVRHVVEVIERNAWALAHIVDGMAEQARTLGDAPGTLVHTPGPPAEAAGRPAEAPPLSSHQLAGLRVLLVDDDRDSREFVRHVLLRAGATVDDAATCAEGLELFARNRPDVVVSDIDLPDRDGYSLLRLLRAHGRGRSVPAVAVTALTRSADAEAALNAGFAAHLSKPVRPDDLCAAVGRVAATPTGAPHPQAAPEDMVPPGRRTPWSSSR